MLNDLIDYQPTKSCQDDTGMTIKEGIDFTTVCPVSRKSFSLLLLFCLFVLPKIQQHRALWFCICAFHYSNVL